MHHHGELARDGDRRSLEAYSLAKFEASGPQRAIGRTAAQNDRRCLIKKPSQMTIAAARYVSIIIDLP
jgi:hypothetical protein